MSIIGKDSTDNFSDSLARFEKTIRLNTAGNWLLPAVVRSNPYATNVGIESIIKIQNNAMIAITVIQMLA